MSRCPQKYTMNSQSQRNYVQTRKAKGKDEGIEGICTSRTNEDGKQGVKKKMIISPDKRSFTTGGADDHTSDEAR